VEPELALQHLAGGPGGVDDVVRQQLAVELGPFQEVALLVVVRDEGDLLVVAHRDASLRHGSFAFHRPSRGDGSAGAATGGPAGWSPSSFHVSPSTALGQPSMRLVALAVFGNAITSRSDSRAPSSMMMRSSPMPMPPCGGDA